LHRLPGRSRARVSNGADILPNADERRWRGAKGGRGATALSCFPRDRRCRDSTAFIELDPRARTRATRSQTSRQRHLPPRRRAQHRGPALPRHQGADRRRPGWSRPAVDEPQLITLARARVECAQMFPQGHIRPMF